jgi:protein-S-isoprenylcysteine O-methyltransferase Ste14
MSDHVHTEDTPRVTELVSGIIADVQNLVRQEVALAKAEVKEEWAKTKTAAVAFAAAAGVAVLSVILVCFAVVYFLNWLTVMPLWACFGIVGVVLGIAGAVLFYSGKTQASRINVVPRQTMETMRENVQWIKNQT